jgi:hypothetical protein
MGKSDSYGGRSLTFHQCVSGPLLRSSQLCLSDLRSLVFCLLSSTLVCEPTTLCAYTIETTFSNRTLDLKIEAAGLRNMILQRV